MIDSLNERADQLIETQQGLAFLSEETGGVTIRNNNDIPGGVRKILEDQSYYLVAYTPDDETFDATKVKFNRINVRVLRPGAKVRTRSGFYNNVASEAPPVGEKATPFLQIMDALSSPFARTDILLRLNPLFAYDEKQGAYVKSYLHIDAKNLKFVDQPGGSKKAAISIIAAAFDERGLPAQQVSKSYAISVKPAGMKQILDDGFIYEFTFPVKKPGGFQYRVALRDDQSGTVGSANQFVQIPKMQKGRHVLSGIVLQNFTAEKWKNIGNEIAATDSVNDTSLRRFSRGTVLQYAFEIYGIDLRSGKPANLSRRIRIFRDGKLVLDGKEQPISPKPGPNGRMTDTAAISIGNEMEPGDYILQVIVSNNLQSEKKKYATQFVQFEIVP
jgi:hypothetical protein